MSIGGVLRLPGQAERRRKRMRALLPGCLGIRYAGAMTAADAAGHAAGVYAGRPHWTSSFDGVQSSLGLAWYTHLEEDKVAEYFTNAAASDANVRRFCPGLQEWMVATISHLLGEPVVQRETWCGPGVHIFPAGDWLSEHGGVVHFDTEGLSPEQLDARTPALTFVLMLQPPVWGGGLRVWDRLFDGDENPKKPRDGTANETIAYEAGDLVVIDSYRMHQIQPFGGRVDRISMTAHTVHVDGAWEAWF
jgi:hypothetical protein